MIIKEYKVIGVMSGTSLDGIDLACINFKYNGIWSFKIECAQTVSYSKEWIDTLQDLVKFSLDELTKIDENYTILLADIINVFVRENNIQNIDAICSHGHTALHQPEKRLTYQIGNLSKLATLTKQKTVCDFRVQDVKLGGQGAPLVPIGDRLLFSEYDFCLNLGGFANISFENNDKRIAYDICPVNIVLNHYTKLLGFDYDNKGEIALMGKINFELLNKLNSLEFYKQSFPKSLGLEWVHKQILPLIDAFNLQIKDILRTFVEHVAIQITSEINVKRNASILVTGGGVFNSFLINRIKSLTNNEIIIPTKDIIEYKEALIFALLGVLKLRNETNCLSSVTGASKDHSSGKIFNFNS